MTVHMDCPRIGEAICDFAEGTLPKELRGAVEAHLRTCAACSQEMDRILKVRGLLSGSLRDLSIDRNFTARTGERLQAVSTGPLRAFVPGSDEDLPQAQAPGLVETLLAKGGGAPWWCISVAFHVLLIALLSLITMAIGNPKGDGDIITVASMERAAKIEPVEEPKKTNALRDILDSKHDTPATDPASDVRSDIVVPPEILAKAELGDHFETVNPDRPDTQSAFGNPDARMFHSESGNDEAAGGGGTGGVSLSEDLIGVGGSGSPGSGGGWGGGNGTGIGVGNGAGHGSFGARTGGGRKLMIMRHGGGPATESAVDKALEWLARNQEADGRWDGEKHGASAPCDPAVTGLALLAFLGAGHTEKIGKYKENVKRGIEWLIKSQRQDGRIPAGDVPHLGYNHAIAGMALAEASAMGRIPATKEAAQKASDYSVNIHQNGEGSEKGGWRYAAKSNVEDISVSGWFIMQLKSAKVAGLHVDPAAFDGAMRFLDSVEVEKAKPGDPYSGHRYAYTKSQVKDPACNGAIGCLGRQFLGVRSEELQGGVEYFLSMGGVPEWKKQHFYYWYYATLCCFQQGGDVWKKWNEAMKKTLIENQCKGGADDGSWEPSGKWVSKTRGGGRVMSTAIGAMCLEVYYRYLPLYR